MLIYYEKVSLSLFLIRYIFIPLFVEQFNIVFSPFICLVYVGFLGFRMCIWMEYDKGVGSPEWFVI
ncbi:MAG: hypothetical protein ACFFAN_04880 [Promethearchaeota archaeon]